jgi:hypothetical protein
MAKDSKNDNSKEAEIKKMISATLNLMKQVKTLEHSCEDCQKCKPFKIITEEILTSLSKIISMQATESNELKLLLRDAHEKLVKPTTTTSQTNSGAFTSQLNKKKVLN